MIQNFLDATDLAEKYKLLDKTYVAGYIEEAKTAIDNAYNYIMNAETTSDKEKK